MEKRFEREIGQFLKQKIVNNIYDTLYIEWFGIALEIAERRICSLFIQIKLKLNVILVQLTKMKNSSILVKCAQRNDVNGLKTLHEKNNDVNMRTI